MNVKFISTPIKLLIGIFFALLLPLKSLSVTRITTSSIMDQPFTSTTQPNGQSSGGGFADLFQNNGLVYVLFFLSIFIFLLSLLFCYIRRRGNVSQRIRQSRPGRSGKLQNNQNKDISSNNNNNIDNNLNDSNTADNDETIVGDATSFRGVFFETASTPKSTSAAITSNGVDISKGSSNSSSKSPYSSSSYNNNSLTAASKELGLSVPGYLQIDYAKDIRKTTVLAQGGFGIVSLADAFTHKLRVYGDIVVVKEFARKSSSSSGSQQISDRDLQLFYQEVSLMEYFKDHKNIAKLLGFSDNPYCLVMKYYHMGSLSQFFCNSSVNSLGGSISRKSGRGVRTKAYLVAFAHDIGKGLAVLHQKDVVHNDLKPDNILIDCAWDNKPYCVLSDLGVCQIVSDRILKIEQFRTCEIRALSWSFAAPERILAFRHRAALANDRDSIVPWDIYSFGIILFSMLTGQKRIYQ